MSINLSRSIIAVGLICSSLTAVSAMAETKKNDMPLPPPGPFTPAANPAMPDNAKPAEAKKVTDAKAAPEGSFAPLNFDPEKPAKDAKAETAAPKPVVKTEEKIEKVEPKPIVETKNRAEKIEPKPVYAPADTAKIPVEDAPTKKDDAPANAEVKTDAVATPEAPALPAAEDVVVKPAEGTVENSGEVKATVPAIKPEKPVETASEQQPDAKSVGDAKADAPKYAPAGTAEMLEKKVSPAKAASEEKAPEASAVKSDEAPSYAPADTAKIPVDEPKKAPVEPAKPAETVKTPNYAPAGTGNAPLPSNAAPAYGYQVPQNRPPQYQPPQYQQPPQGYGYAPQYYPSQRGFWPQPYQQQMPPRGWGYQQPQWQQPQWQQPWQQRQPQWQQPWQQRQPQWQQPWQQRQPQWQPWPMQPQGYGFPNPYNGNPYGQPRGWPQRQQGQQQPQQFIPQNNSSAGN